MLMPIVSVPFPGKCLQILATGYIDAWLTERDKSFRLHHEFPYAFVDLVPHSSKHWKTFFFSSSSVRRIIKRPMKPNARPGKHRTGFFGVIADCDDVGKLFLEISRGALGFMAGNVDAGFAHHLHGQRIQRGWVCAR